MNFIGRSFLRRSHFIIVLDASNLKEFSHELDNASII